MALPDNDQACLRFLWRQSPESLPEVYQCVRHTFGGKCAPTCSNYAFLRNAEDTKAAFLMAVLAVKRNFSMDDFPKSVKSTFEAVGLKQQLLELLT